MNQLQASSCWGFRKRINPWVGGSSSPTWVATWLSQTSMLDDFLYHPWPWPYWGWDGLGFTTLELMNDDS